MTELSAPKTRKVGHTRRSHVKTEAEKGVMYLQTTGHHRQKLEEAGTVPLGAAKVISPADALIAPFQPPEQKTGNPVALSLSDFGTVLCSLENTNTSTQ